MRLFTHHQLGERKLAMVRVRERERERGKGVYYLVVRGEGGVEGKIGEIKTGDMEEEGR